MTSPISVVVAKVEPLNLKIELCDKRTLYIGGRPCQAIKSKWYEKLSWLQSDEHVHASQ